MHPILQSSLLRSRRLGAGSIREVVFGVEDGVVQNMTLIAGMVGAALSNRIIVIAAAINAIAGVLSMSMGTYLSSKAERDVAAASGDASFAIDAAPQTITPSPRWDALVMAGAYAFGATVPLLPFVGGLLDHPQALALAVVLTAVTLFLLGVGKARLSHQRPLRSGVEMLVLASAAGLAGYLLGVAARAVFGLDV